MMLLRTRRLFALGFMLIGAGAADAAAARPQNFKTGHKAVATNRDPAAPGPGQGLVAAYLAAVKRSETIDIQKELLVQTQELKTQAGGAFLPSVQGYGTWVHQKLPSAPWGSSSPSDPRTTRLNADLPLFMGFRDLSLLNQRKYLIEAQIGTYKTAAKQLFFDLATAYYNVLSLQSDERNYKDEIEVNRKRLGELRHFLQIGRSRNTDLLTFQSNISSLESQLENTHGQLEVAKDVLAFLTGWNRETAIADTDHLPAVGTLDQNLARIDQRPDVRSALSSAKAATEGVPLARSGHYPTLDLQGNYYFDRTDYPSYKEDWDVQLLLTLPIYEGGVVQSQVRQAQSVAHESDLTLSQTRRLAEEEIRTLYSSYTADQRQVMKLEETYDWAKKSFEAEQADYRRGLVTNLEVLQAITAYQDSQRLLDRQRLQMRLDGVKLQAAAARRDEIDLDPSKQK